MIRVFRQYIPRSFIVLAIVEFFLVFLATHLAIQARNMALGQELESSEWYKALLIAFAILICMAAMGLYQRRFRHGLIGMSLRLVSAFFIGGLFLSLVFFLLPSLYLGRGIMILTFVFALIFLYLTRLIFLHTIDQDIMKRRVLVLGAGHMALQIRQNLRRRVDQRGFIIAGYVHVRGEHDTVEEYHVIRPDVPLLELAERYQVDEIVVAVGDRRRKSFPVHELLDCKMSGIEVLDLPTFFEREVGKIMLDSVNPSWFIFSEGFNQGNIRDFSKRAFDVLMSLLLLCIAWPFMLMVVCAIWIEEGLSAPIIYKQVRVGQHWKLFNVFKFRSMRADAEKAGQAQWAQVNDARVTRVGNVIRKVRLDELPQLFNVLRGDMSFVGPRPERPQFVTQLVEQIPYYAERHRMKPGITGWAQVCYPYGASEKDALEKLQYDLYYIKNYSLFLDMVVILQTAHEVLWVKGGR